MTWDGRRVQGELWLARRLGIADLYRGVTSRESRRERLRVEIMAGGLANQIAGTNAAGEQETFERCFERLYGEPLG